MADYQDLVQCYIDAAFEGNESKCDELEAEFIRKYGNDALSLFKKEKLPSIPRAHTSAERKLTATQRYYQDKKEKRPFSLQQFDINQMWTEYNNLIICYANAQTRFQVNKCDSLAQDFTQRYGSATSLVTVTLDANEKREISSCIDKLEKEAIKFRKQYYKAKPQVKRDLQQAVAEAEANLNSIDAQFDQVRQFLGLKTLAASTLSLQETFDYDVMINEYFELLDCYLNAKTVADVAVCDKRTDEFTVKYGATPLALQAINYTDMWTEYSDLINCYFTAKTQADVNRCDARTQAFTEKYGGQTLASQVSLQGVLDQEF